MANVKITNWAILNYNSKPANSAQRKKIKFTSAGFLQTCTVSEKCNVLKPINDQQLSQPSCSSVVSAATSTSASSNATPDSITDDLTNVPSPGIVRRRLTESMDQDSLPITNGVLMEGLSPLNGIKKEKPSLIMNGVKINGQEKPSPATNGVKTNGTTKLETVSPSKPNFIGPLLPSQMPSTSCDNAQNTQINRKRKASETLDDEAHFPYLDGRISHFSWKGCQNVVNKAFGAGLVNDLNDCFLNAVLQSVVYTPHLARYILDHEFDCPKRRNHQRCLHCTLKNFISRVMQNYNAVHPRSFMRDHMREIFPHHRANSQEDAHEMLCLLLGALEPPLPKNTSMGTAKIIQKTSTPIEQIFGGTLKNQYRCDVCATVHTNYERIREINLGLKLKKYEGRTLLSEIIRDFFQPEKIHSFTCKNCKVKRIVTRTTQIMRAPSVLVIQLKRFNAFGSKISLPVESQLSLDLRPYTYNDVEVRYKLNGIIQHLGSSVNSGHYVAAHKGFDESTWFRFDDETVTQISFEQVRNQMQPYILFYIRQNVQFSSQNKRMQLMNPNANRLHSSAKLNQTAPPRLLNQNLPAMIPTPSKDRFKPMNQNSQIVTPPAKKLSFQIAQRQTPNGIVNRPNGLYFKN